MKSLKTKLLLSALAVAVLATPALAQKTHHQSAHQELLSPTAGNGQTDVGTYPNGAIRSGSAYSRESGADDNLIR
jgi:hypothetical protein